MRSANRFRGACSCNAVSRNARACKRAAAACYVRAKALRPICCTSSLFGHVGKLPEGSIGPLGLRVAIYLIYRVALYRITFSIGMQTSLKTAGDWQGCFLLQHLLHGNRTMASYRGRDAIYSIWLWAAEHDIGVVEESGLSMSFWQSLDRRFLAATTR